MHNKIDRFVKNFRRRKFYTPVEAVPHPYKGDPTKWEIVKTKKTNENLHILCRDTEKGWTREYVVFSFWLKAPNLKKHIPSDKFTYGAKRGRALFKEITSEDT